MELPNLHNVDECIWLISDNKVTQKIIESVTIYIDPLHNVHITYTLKNCNGSFIEEKLHKSKEALLQSL